MSDLLKTKFGQASNLSSADISVKIKSEVSERFDQMILSSELSRNDIYYNYYSVTFVNHTPFGLKVALVSSINNTFTNRCCGGSHIHGKIDSISQDFLQKLKEHSKFESEIVGVSAPSKFKDSGNYIKPQKNFSKLKKIIVKAANDVDAKKNKNTSVKDDLLSFADDLKEMQSDIKNLYSFNLSPSGDSAADAGSTSFNQLKSRYFDLIEIDEHLINNSISKQITFIPDLTNSETCSTCRGNGEVTCRRCNGKGQNTCSECSGNGRKKCNQCRGGQRQCTRCTGNGYTSDGKRCINRCQNGLLACNSCGGQVIIDCKECSTTGKVDCKKCRTSGKVDCETCDASGELGTIIYIETNIDVINIELLKFSDFVFPDLVKKPEVLVPYFEVDRSGSKIYDSTNGTVRENYDQYSKQFSHDICKSLSLHKDKNWPKVIKEVLHYDVLPVITIDYDHVLSGTKHKVSAFVKTDSFNLHFHSEPTAVNKYSGGNFIKIIKWSLLKAISSKSYNSKNDKHNEISLLIRLAKADGKIDDSEKIVLMNTISNLNEFSAQEKSRLFDMFSKSDLPPISYKETVFSTKERADIAIDNFNKIIHKDGAIAETETVLLSSIIKQIGESIGKHRRFPASLLYTWEVNIPFFIILILSSVLFLYYPEIKLSAMNRLDFHNDKIVNFEPESIPASTVLETLVNEHAQSELVNDSISNSDNLNTFETAPDVKETGDSAVSNPKEAFLGDWTGDFGNKSLIIHIDSITQNNVVFGFNTVNGNTRDLRGVLNYDLFELSEPGTDKWDGVFTFKIANETAEGEWASNNGKLKRRFKLNHKLEASE